MRTSGLRTGSSGRARRTRSRRSRRRTGSPRMGSSVSPRSTRSTPRSGPGRGLASASSRRPGRTGRRLASSCGWRRNRDDGEVVVAERRSCLPSGDHASRLEPCGRRRSVGSGSSSACAGRCRRRAPATRRSPRPGTEHMNASKEPSGDQIGSPSTCAVVSALGRPRPTGTETSPRPSPAPTTICAPSGENAVDYAEYGVGSALERRRIHVVELVLASPPCRRRTSSRKQARSATTTQAPRTWSAPTTWAATPASPAPRQLDDRALGDERDPPAGRGERDR